MPRDKAPAKSAVHEVLTCHKGLQRRNMPLLLLIIAPALFRGFLLGRHVTRIQLVPQGVYTSLVREKHYFLLHVHGQSMEPQPARDDYVLVEQTKRGIRRGDILVTRDSGDHCVVGLPGETVWVSHGRVRVRGPGAASCRRLAEPYVHYPDASATFGPIAARDGRVIMADDRYLFPRLAPVVAPSAVVGVIRGLVLSDGELYPARPQGWPAIPTRPSGPTLIYQP